MNDKINSLLRIAELKCADIERFPGYFRFKKTETCNILNKINFDKNTVALEIGCGTGFQSSLLSTVCEKVISTDLPDFSKKSHTIGLKCAKDMALRLGTCNINHLGCSIIGLPFKDKSFDCIFSFAVLEHIDNKNAALMEMRRVLKDDGIIVCSVPTYVASVFEFPALYLYMASRVFDVVKNRLLKKKINNQSIFFKDDRKDDNNFKTLGRGFFVNYPSFPFPEPHGEWRNKKGRRSIFVECYEQLPWRWCNRFIDSGLKIKSSFAVLYIPYRIVEIFSPQLLTSMYCNSQFLHRNLFDSFLKYFSVAICYVARKDKGL